MARGLATRCSACGTVFRVVPDQLRVSEGWVRCGRCTQVFNALEGLVDLETGLPRPTGSGSGAAGAGLAPQVDADSDDDYEVAQPAARPGGPPLPGDAGTPPAPAKPGAGAAAMLPGRLTRPSAERSGTALLTRASTAPSLSASAPAETHGRGVPGDLAAAVAEASDSELEPHRAGAVAPSFVRNAERAARWQQPRVRLGLALVAALAALLLVAQAGLHHRDLVAARWPDTRPLLVQACQALGCRVEAARSIDGLAVESSGLVRVEKSELYRLQVTLRNRAGIELAVPALDVTLSDAQGRLIARKVLRLAELGAPQATIAAGREVAVLATLQAVAGSDAALQPIAGYTVELFYP